VDLQVLDGATFNAAREDPERFELFQGGHSFAFAGINPLVNTQQARDGFWNRYQDVDGRMEAAREAYARAATRTPRRPDELTPEQGPPGMAFAVT
jgi:hypothetical protein